MNKIDLNDEILEEAKVKFRNKDKDIFKFLKRIIDKQDSNSDYILQFKLFLIYAKSYTYLKYNYNKSVEILSKLKKDKRLNFTDYDLLAEIDFFLGINHQYLGNYIDSFICYRSSIDFYEKIKDISKNEELNIANALINIGSLHKLNDYEEYDKEDINRALQIYKKHQAKQGISNCYSLFAAYAFNNKNYKESHKYVNKALSLNNETNNLVGIAICFGNIGSLYAVQGEYDKAFSYLKKSYDKIIPLVNDFLLALHDKNLGDYYQLRNDSKKAITNYRKALDFFEANQNKDQLVIIYKGLADIYSKTNQYKKAYQYLEKHNEIKKTSFKFDKVSAIYKTQKNIS
jgi:tetratricopeptide (TPR) repeat protein